MFPHAPQEVRFAVGFRGYAREPVDTVVEQCELSISETRAQLERTETSAAEADSRVQALKARVSELEERGPDGSAPGNYGLTRGFLVHPSGPLRGHTVRHIAPQIAPRCPWRGAYDHDIATVAGVEAAEAMDEVLGS